MRKILFVAMQMSTHAARWINQVADQGWDLHLFPVNHLPVIPELRGVTVHQPFLMVRPRELMQRVRNAFATGPIPALNLAPRSLAEKPIFPLPMVPQLARIVNAAKRIRLGESDSRVGFFYGPQVLAHLVHRLKPDLIHSMEFQHCGYNVLRAKELAGSGFPSWLATNWGSDIYYYRQFDDHRRQISRLLQAIDFYSCECERDVALARDMGMDAHVLPVMPNTGGLDLQALAPMRRHIPPSRRRVVMVKGYQHFAGRALLALEAIERCSDELQGFRILVFSASAETIERVGQLQRESRLDIDLVPYSNHETMLQLFSDARVYLGVSISDAISTSMLEAMATGAFPIQTDTSCCDEWIEDGRDGFIIPSDDVVRIAERLKLALTDDALVDAAAEKNWQTVRARLDKDILKTKAIALYDEVFARLGK
jgi:glycosyltransferase involved in cell wall biosynthesis